MLSICVFLIGGSIRVLSSWSLLEVAGAFLITPSESLLEVAGVILITPSGTVVIGSVQCGK